jgi:CRISPR-associated protein Csm5
LKVFTVLVAVRTPNGLRWIQAPRRRNQSSRYTNDHTQAIANFCECLDASANGMIVAVVEDMFLCEGRAVKGERDLTVPNELRWESTKLEAIANWKEACNKLAEEVAGKEHNWWQQVKSLSQDMSAQMVAAAMERFYANLLKQIQAESKQAIFLNLGWGSGWRTKTVTEIFGDEVVQRVVSRYNLDRGSRSRPFPKTRKVVWFGDNEFAPLGWVKLVPVR